MKHKTGCNMWVDQRALKLTITGPDLASVEHAAKSVDAYVAAAPIKAGAVEAAVTKKLECPPHLLDILGDRTTIARIVKETHAQVVVNKKIGSIIVRGDPRSVDHAYASVKSTIHTAMNGGLGLRVDTPGSHGSHGGAGYFSGSVGGGGGGRSPASMSGLSGGLSPMEGIVSGVGVGGGGHMLPSHMTGFRAIDTPEFRSLGSWPHQQQQQQELQQQLQLQRRHDHHRRDGTGRGSESDDSEIETASLGSIGARTPASSTAGSPRAAVSYRPSPTLSGTASTPGGDWSLFSSGFGLGISALQESSSTTSSPRSSSRISPRVHFPEGVQALMNGDDDTVTAENGSGSKDGADFAPKTPVGVRTTGSPAPPPSPASTSSGEASRKMRRRALEETSVLRGALEEDGVELKGEVEDIVERVERLGARLQAMGLGKYRQQFAENEVDSEALALMSERDLADIGIPKGPRIKILNAVGGRVGAGHTPAI